MLMFNLQYIEYLSAIVETLDVWYVWHGYGPVLN